MCGIVGIFNIGEGDKDFENMRREASIFLATELLQVTQDRGKDATGVVNLYANGQWHGLKSGVASGEFITRWEGKETDYLGFLDIWRSKKSTHKVFMGHCRKSSVGNSTNNVNNHPIKIGNIVGIHNGTLENHNKIFEKLKCGRDGDVDSEAIMRLLSHYTEGGTRPFTVDIVKQTALRLQGTYAVLAFNGDNPYQVVAFRDGRPMEMVLIRPLNMVIVASEKTYIEQAMFRLNKNSALYGYGSYPVLTTKDLDFHTLPDDTVAVLDLNHEITDKTEVKDLYKSEKLPTRSERLWKVEVKTTTGYSYGNSAYGTYRSNGYTKENSNATTAVTTTSVTTTVAKPLSLVWNRDSNSYKFIDDVKKKTDSLGGVELPVDSELIILPDDTTEVTVDNMTGEIIVEEISIAPEDVVTDDACIINEIVVAELLETATKKEFEDSIKEASLEKEVVFQDAASIKADIHLHDVARKAATDVNRFKSLDDIVEALDLTSASILTRLSTIAIANRVKKHAFEAGYYAALTSGATSKDLYKKQKAEHNIRTLKVIQSLITDVHSHTKEHPEDTDIIKLVHKYLSPKAHLRKGDITSVFSEGNISKDPILRTVISVIENRNNDDVSKNTASSIG